MRANASQTNPLSGGRDIMAHCSPGKPRLNLCVLELQNRRGYRHGIQRHRYRCWPLCSIDCRKDGRLLRWKGRRWKAGKKDSSIRSRVTLIARNPVSGSLAARLLVVARLRVSLRTRTETDRFFRHRIESRSDVCYRCQSTFLPFQRVAATRKSAEDRSTRSLLTRHSHISFRFHRSLFFLFFFFFFPRFQFIPIRKIILWFNREIFVFTFSYSRGWVDSSLAVEISNSRHPRLGKMLLINMLRGVPRFLLRHQFFRVIKFQSNQQPSLNEIQRNTWVESCSKNLSIGRKMVDR